MKTLRVLFGLFVMLLIPVPARAEIGVIVNKNLYPFIKPALDQYIEDVRNTGETVWLEKDRFDHDSTLSELQALRTVLRNRHLKASDPLTGAVLIGRLPRADYESWNVGGIEYLRFPIDYYFMDLDQQTDSDWKDNNPAGSPPPGATGVFDEYTGSGTMEIWVSRVIAHNFDYEDEDITIGHPEDEDDSRYAYGTEIEIINDYLRRVHLRMAQVDAIPRRGLSVGDYKNGMNPSDPGLQNLNIPYITLKYPHDTPAVWARELQKGYEIAAIFEHSNPGAHAMAQDQGENNTGSFWYGNLLRMPVEGGAGRVRFFNDLGCSNLKYSSDNCLGQMYAMLHDGLISMGATSLNWFGNSYAAYTEKLSEGKNFGEAFKAYVNTKGNGFGSLTMTLLGAGTLKFEPYVPNPQPALVIKKAWAEKTEKGLFLHGDGLTLRAELDCVPAGVCSTQGASVSWHGLSEPVSGNPALYALEGHNAPLNTRHGVQQGEYFVTLHVEKPGYRPAVEVLSLKGWKFAKVGPTYYIDSLEHDPENENPNQSPAHLNRHWQEDNEWVAWVRGLSGDIGGQEDDFVFYYSDIQSGDFEVTARIKSWHKDTASYDPWAKAGVMIRLHESAGSVNAFMGVTHGHGAVFQFRDSEGGFTQRFSLPGYAAGNTWVRLRRLDQTVYGYVSEDGVNFRLAGNMFIGPAASPLVGFAYACNDPIVWYWSNTPGQEDFSQERGVKFSAMKVRALSDPKPVVPLIEYVNEINGRYTVYFAYQNPNGFDALVETGPLNYFSYNGQWSWNVPTPITDFDPGRIFSAFSVDFDGSELVWYLQGRSVSTRGAAIRHLRIIPHVERVINNCDGTCTAFFGYESPHPFAVTKATYDPLNELKRTEGDYNSTMPVTEFRPGRVYDAFSTKFKGTQLAWNLDAYTATATAAMAQNICPPFKFYKAFAFGADGWTREVPNAPGNFYTKVVQNGANFRYDSSRGYGYTQIHDIDTSLNNRGVLSGPDEIYDQFIGVFNPPEGDSYPGYYFKSISFRVDVPKGVYRFVAAGGDALYPGHTTTIAATSSYSGDYGGRGYGGYYGTPLVENLTLPINSFFTVGFDTKRPPPGDGSGVQPNFLPLKESPYLRVTVPEWTEDPENAETYIEINQIAPGDPGVHGGDLCLLELWYIPEQKVASSLTGGVCASEAKLRPLGNHDPALVTPATDPPTRREAKDYFGCIDIDQVVDMADASGQRSRYAVGWHGGDAIEYLMEYGGVFDTLVLRGIADLPGPYVELDVYIDGLKKATVRWDAANNRNQEAKVTIPGIASGTHAIAVRFANDAWVQGGGPDRDRNLYLTQLWVTASWLPESLTNGTCDQNLPNGYRVLDRTPVNTPRPANRYYGCRHIDQIANWTDPDGKSAMYVTGWHGGDLVEYLMELGGEAKYLTLTGLADRPGPVYFHVYVDGEYQATSSWDFNNNRIQQSVVEIPIRPGIHAVAVEYANDFNNPGTIWDADRDANFSLNGLKVTTTPGPKVTKIVSDGSWKSLDREENGWTAPSFDDYRWRNAYAPYPNGTPTTNWIPGTTAKYIWDFAQGTPNGQNGPRDAWFRKRFSLPVDPGELESATAVVGADDDFSLYVNGSLMEPADWNGTLWGAPYTYDIKPFLVKGSNVLAIHARDTYGLYEWLLFDATIVRSGN